MYKGIMALFLMLAINLNAEIRVLAFSGSTRSDSTNKKLVNEAANFAKELGANVKVIDLRDYNLPLYDGDLEVKEGLPQKAKELRKLMMESQVILIASPEYNSSLSAILKNTIDWASRGEKRGPSLEPFKDKTFVIMSASPGSKGGARGLVHLRAILEEVGGKVFSEQIVVPDAYNAFNDQKQLKNPQLREKLQNVIERALNK